MLVETVHGVLRSLLLAPRIGAEAAERAGWWVASALVIAIAVATIRWTQVKSAAGLLRLGALWAVLTILFEIVIGALRGLDGSALLAALNPLSGSIMWSAALMLAAPVLAARLRGAS